MLALPPVNSNVRAHRIMSHWQAVHDHFKRKNVLGAISLLEDYISSNNSQKFSCLVGASFSNTKLSICNEINRLIAKNEEEFEVKSVYIEMNGFDINYDRWYFDLFSYASYTKDFEETEWLCEWQSAPWPEVELFGMQPAQEAFAWYHENRIWRSQPEFKPIYEASMLLVMAKFAGLIGSALEVGRLAKPVPILATAHGFESVARFEP